MWIAERAERAAETLEHRGCNLRVTCREMSTETRRRSAPPLCASSQLASLLAGAAGRRTTADNAGGYTEQVGKWRKKQPLRRVRAFLVQLQLQVACFKCHLLERDAATYPLLLQDPLFLQCQPGSEQTKAPPPPGSSAPRSPEAGRTRASLPDDPSLLGHGPPQPDLVGRTGW